MKLLFSIFLTTSLATSAIAVCDDTASDCNLWIPLCNSIPPNPYVAQNCQLTCQYCVDTTSATCFDVGKNCNLLNICDDPKFADIAWRECRSYCNLCNAPDPSLTTTSNPCVDSLPPTSCMQMYSFCNDEQYAPLMEQECAKTCGFC